MILRENYLDAQKYLEYHARIKQNTAGTLSVYDYQLRLVLRWCDDVPFPDFKKAKITLPEYLKAQKKFSGMSEETCSDICALFRDFLHFHMSENRSRYGKLKESDVVTVRYITHMDSTKTARYYTLEEMGKIADYEPETLAEKRARASACFLYLSGMRISAFLSMPIECVNLQQKTVYQFPENGVVTKFGKKAITTLLPIKTLLDVVSEWDEFLQTEKMPSGALWYAQIDRDGKRLEPYCPEIGSHDEAYKSARHRGNKFRDYLKRLCLLCGIEYKNPHAFRHGHVHYGLSHAKTVEQIKAISQNVMHRSTAITDEVYSRMNYSGVSNAIANLDQSEVNRVKTETVPGLSVSGLVATMPIEEKKQLLKELLGL